MDDQSTDKSKTISEANRAPQERRSRASSHVWRSTDYIGPFTLLISAVLGIAALVIAKQSMTKVEATRVEMGRLITNSNGPDFTNPWTGWERRLTDRVTFVGIQKKIYFKKPFLNAPSIQAAYSGIEVAPLDTVMLETGYPLTDPVEARRLRDLHIVTDIADPASDHFVLQVGVGLPVPCGDHIIKYLSDHPPDQSALGYAHRWGQLDPNARSDQLTPDEKWMWNFYTTFGTLGVTWVAKAEQD